MPQISSPEPARSAGSQVLVDEIKSRGYVMAAASVTPTHTTLTRLELRELLPGLERIHFKSERDAQRRQILAVMCDLEIQVEVFIAHTKDHVAGRRAPLASR